MSHHHLSTLTCLIVSSKELKKLSYDPDQGWLRSDRKAGDGQDCLPQWKLFYGLKDLEITSATKKNNVKWAYGTCQKESTREVFT